MRVGEDLATASVPAARARPRVSAATGLCVVEVNVRRKERGHNAVAETKGHPVLMFLGKFWGLSAGMLELERPTERGARLCARTRARAMRGQP